MIMTESDAAYPDPLTLRERVRAGGGWYAWLNTKLISLAGPAAVGPYETTPPLTRPRSAPSARAHCAGTPMTEHTFDRSGPKPLMHCP